MIDLDELLEITKRIMILRGGRTSGNWAHGGRKGKRGGSGKGGGFKRIGAKSGKVGRKKIKQLGRRARVKDERAKSAGGKGSKKSDKPKKTKKGKDKSKPLKDRNLEDLSRDELLTLQGRVNKALAKKDKENSKLAGEQPNPTHGHTTKARGTDPKQEFEMRYEIKELDDLIASNTDGGAINPAFPQELQPRDRTRVASKRQIDKIAADIEPGALLDEFKAIDRGTPIVGPDGVVESGNGRTLALRRARDIHPDQMGKYQDALKATVSEKGIDPAALDGFKNPVLVRVRTTDVDRAEFAKAANTASILGVSDTERARSDASRISAERLQGMEVKDNIDQTIRSPRNREFVRSFIANTPETERATMIDKNGGLTKSGEDRIKAAMFNRVYDSPALSDKIFESTDSDIKNVTNGVMNSLGTMAKAEELVRTGQRNKGLSLAGDVTKAVEKLSALKDSGQTVDNFLNQGALFGRELTPIQEKLLVELDKRKRSGKKVKEMFDDWGALVDTEPHPDQGSFFGSAGRSKQELFDTWLDSINDPNKGQGSLF